IGWAQGVTFPGSPFNQQMTVPVELRCYAYLGDKNTAPRLCATPVHELAALRDGKPVFEVGAEPLICKERRTLASELDAFEAELCVSATNVPNFTVNLRGIDLVYDAAKGTLTCKDVSAPLPERWEGVLDLRILVDRGSVEVFGNGGRVAMSIA